MSLLLTRHVHQNCINIEAFGRSRSGPHGLRTTGLEPFTNQLSVKTIMFDNEHSLHGGHRK
jgi:hypothetical protein